MPNIPNIYVAVAPLKKRITLLEERVKKLEEANEHRTSEIHI